MIPAGHYARRAGNKAKVARRPTDGRDENRGPTFDRLAGPERFVSCKCQKGRAKKWPSRRRNTGRRPGRQRTRFTEKKSSTPTVVDLSMGREIICCVCRANNRRLASSWPFGAATRARTGLTTTTTTTTTGLATFTLACNPSGHYGLECLDLQPL